MDSCSGHLSQKSREVLGTHINLSVMGEAPEIAMGRMDRAFLECERIEKLYSRFIERNELWQMNQNVNEWQEVSEELFGLLELGLRAHEKTEGAFDLTVKSVLEGWGYDASYSLQERFEGKTGSIELNPASRQVRISASVDLGGIGKGYALDRMATLFWDFENYCLDAGGDIIAKGKGQHGEGWKVAFEHPLDIGKAIGEVLVNDFALASSSPSRRHWGKRHHLVDPQRNLPAEGMLIVYTQAPAAILADVYSTALFVMGYEKAKEMLPNLPVEALLMAPDGRVFQSAGFQGDLYA